MFYYKFYLVGSSPECLLGRLYVLGEVKALSGPIHYNVDGVGLK